MPSRGYLAELPSRGCLVANAQKSRKLNKLSAEFVIILLRFREETEAGLMIR